LIDIKILFKLPYEYGKSGEGKEIFKECCKKFSNINVSESDYYYSCEGDEDIFILEFCYKDCNIVHKSLLKNEQLKQLEKLQNYIFKKQGLKSKLSVGRKNKLSKSDWSYVNILDTKSQTFLCCTSS
jgi:hypothetical protein